MAYLKVVSHHLVAASKEADRTFNTLNHSPAEIENALPNFRHLEPKPQPWLLLSPWLDLVLSSQRIPRDSVHQILLPRSFLLFLKHASESALLTGRVPEADAEELADLFPTSTIRGKNIAALIQKTKYFARLDTCSLKDAIVGEGPIKNVKDIWTRLATSSRGMMGIRDIRNADPESDVYLWLFPWNENIQTRFEYRVFCCPPEGEMVAVSQYQWHSKWYHGEKKRQEQHDIAERLVMNCQVVHDQIMEHSAMTEEIRESGFVFDVVEDPDTQQVALLELNDFGAMSCCGSCLFQWIKDAEVLYGMKVEEGVEVRVAY
ncbi:uncharacterized protein KY384_006256 [Bacidia gigantensis]|uniref:uncharacterized protein n=1 Tax=Bacidia gigantensis TaxID=2732470 RepID=UPI001D052470|nr:uncharacterized protein KY384_006256 [Bacidia gigantensis]KAG8529619.1 hypothetical protein KY384_006256 [Bacidia gigantensis]